VRALSVEVRALSVEVRALCWTGGLAAPKL
jgi:hypothetical protein